jgi:hypothetical protein
MVDFFLFLPPHIVGLELNFFLETFPSPGYELLLEISPRLYAVTTTPETKNKKFTNKQLILYSSSSRSRHTYTRTTQHTRGRKKNFLRKSKERKRRQRNHDFSTLISWIITKNAKSEFFKFSFEFSNT